MRVSTFKLIALTLLLTSSLAKAQITTVTLQPGAAGIDAFVASYSATTNYQNDIKLQTAKVTAGSVKQLLSYDLTSIPPNAIITSAKLTLVGTAHSGTNPSLLQKNTSTWAENTVTWNLAPTTTTVGQLSLAQSTAATQTYTMDVKAMVQEMVNIPAANFGWTLTKTTFTSTGGLVFASSDHTTAASRPKLEIAYCLPMVVNGYMTAATASTTATGALNVSVFNGVPPYTYSWSDGSTTKDIYNKLPGLYTLTITDAVANQTKKMMLIAAENATMSFTITPDALAGTDGLVQLRDDGTLANSNFKNDAQLRAERINSSGWLKTRALMSFDLMCIPSNAIINSATLNLYGNGHNPLNRPNDSYLYLNTSTWDESTLTWNTQPTHNTVGSIYMPATTTANQNAALNVLSYVQGWVQNPSSNFGLKLALANETTASTTSLIYGSSDNANAALRTSLVISITVPVLTDAQRNWEMTETYDQNGQVIATTKTYMDELGRATQSLSKDALGDVLAQQTVYDAYGRPAISTLPAYSGNTLMYNTQLFKNTTGAEYNYTNFDVAGKINNPDAVQVGLNNTIGTYYSNSNTIDTWQATATLPFNRTHYMADPYSSIKTTNAAENAFNATSGREARNYSMVCGDELRYIFGTTNSYKVSLNVSNPLISTPLTITAADYIKATKSITTSPDNKEMVSYSIGDKVVATCLSGLSSPDNCSMATITNYMDWYGTQAIDIHVPDANKANISFPLPTYQALFSLYTVANSEINYTITNLQNETVLVNPTDYSINATSRALTFTPAFLAANAGKPLFLRITVVYTTTFLNTLLSQNLIIPKGIVQYNLDYGRWGVSYYDLAGNLRKNVSAKGINCSSPGAISMATTYDYSHLGQLIATQSPDEGLSEIAYNTDGQTRFTQNALQKLNNKMSYTNYDTQNRPVESGEFTNTNTAGANGVYFQNYYSNYTAPFAGNVSSATLVNNNDGLNDTYCNDTYFSAYEALTVANDVPSTYTYAGNYPSYYRNGMLSKTWNQNTATWYKYDQAGRAYATIKKINDADFTTYAGTGDAQIKTNEITYDPYFGIPTNTYYQKNVSTEYAMHEFLYDANKRVNTVNFTAGLGGTPTSISALTFNKLGQVIRNIIGPNLQGVDYVYTLSGQLKAINHPSLDYLKDRGGDNKVYNVSKPTGVKYDLFGEIIEYFPGDYTRAGTSIEANTNGLYTGKIYGTRYKTRNVVGATNTGADYIDYLGTNQLQIITGTYTQQELANRYTYDAFGQLANSTFGNFNNSTLAFTARTEYKEFGATNNSIAYDANGNITNLKRNAYVVSGSQQLLDNLTYNYTANTNKHSSVADAAVNAYGASFNYKNQTGTPSTMLYDANGQLTQSLDEQISLITYYPNGQVKQIDFASGNSSYYFYDDQGQRYKTAFFSATGLTTKYNWYVNGVMYEYVYVPFTPGTFNLKQLTVSGASGRAGVYKQDVTGLNLSLGHMEYELTDHLGNVRVTFKATPGTTNLEVLSKTDYYAFGGVLPGRVWQQSGGEYRFGYQGQLKSENDVNWDEFELRLFNHDLGRWSAPDPYGQFDSPYIGMGNDPVNQIDPDGGYTNASSDGTFLNRLKQQIAQDKFLHQGHYSYEYLYGNYKEELDQLFYTFYPSGQASDGNSYNGTGKADDYLNAVYELNNKYLGLGLASDALGSGIYSISNVARGANSDLVKRNVAQTTATPQNDAVTNMNNSFDAAADAYDNNVWNSAHREYVDKWREDKWKKQDEIEAKEKAENKEKKSHDPTGEKLNSGEDVGDMPLAVNSGTNTPNQKKECKNQGRSAKKNDRIAKRSFGFANGFRINNFVIFDIRINSSGKNPWQTNFPGREGKKNNYKWRYQVFYRVEKSKYNLMQGGRSHTFYGGYKSFFECPDYTNFGGRSHRLDHIK